ncbi:hypothetical protein ACH5RR_040743 [Cinchona calisaya]|uniref:Uncharacterized protein n=1 Tax=Cinchona calisaya TaxID=153742 RepID=A0ABD2XU78_9GENT
MDNDAKCSSEYGLVEGGVVKETGKRDERVGFGGLGRSSVRQNMDLLREGKRKGNELPGDEMMRNEREKRDGTTDD